MHVRGARKTRGIPVAEHYDLTWQRHRGAPCAARGAAAEDSLLVCANSALRRLRGSGGGAVLGAGRALLASPRAEEAIIAHAPRNRT